LVFSGRTVWDALVGKRGLKVWWFLNDGYDREFSDVNVELCIRMDVGKINKRLHKDD
jgi:hypothetical protein